MLAPDALQPLDRAAVTVTDGFWASRLDTLRATTVEFVYDRLVESGRVENFRIAAGETDGEFAGRFYNDSDVYKWIEAASYLLADEHDPDLAARVQELVSLVAAAQSEDGYLNTYFQLVEPDRRWTNLHRMHELYCAGHLFEAAVAHHEATGAEDLLDVARAFADHIDERFGLDGRDGVPGHEEIELALVRLYRTSGEERYLQLAQYFVDARGREDSPLRREVEHPEGRAGEPLGLFLDAEGNYDGSYAQDHAPLREQSTVEGHAVRATYLFAGAADVAAETGDEALFVALERLWENLTGRRMYVTGGIGSEHAHEGFTGDYDLPNETAYAETCAALGSVQWCRRMFAYTGEARYLDVVERTLYNGFLAGVSLAGTRFFYVNPLALSGDEHPLRAENPNRFAAERQGWFETACCPTNVPRLLASLPGYVSFVDEAADRLVVALHVSSEATAELDGVAVELTMETAQPWEPATRIAVSSAEPATFELAVRVPDWCAAPTVAVNGDDVDVDAADGFARVERTWTDGDELAFDAEFPVRVLRAHPAVEADAGRIALQRGPIVYCLEGVDHDRPLHQLALRTDDAFRPVREEGLFDGVTTLEGSALAPTLDGWDGELYRDDREVSTTEVPVRAVPYYAWGHRGPNEMRVWNRTVGE